MKKIIISTVLVLSFILLGTALAIFYAKGYRFTTNEGKPIFQGTGILSLSSSPEGAKVYINGNLTTATNNTLNLRPGTYDVEIRKEGYFSWKKTVVIKKELVTEANALLFPTTPKFEPITITGVENLAKDPSGTILAYTVSSSSATGKNGVYVLDMNSRPILPTSSLTSQLIDNTAYDFSKAQLSFDPEGDQILASISGQLATSYVLLAVKGNNDNPQNVTVTLPQVLQEWQNEGTLKEKKTLDALPKGVKTLVTDYFDQRKVSPDQTKIYYQAKKDGMLPIVINPRLLELNSTPESRDIRAGNIYVYDVKEDRNYLVYEKKEDKKTPEFIWFPDSEHLVFVEDNQVKVIESDGMNTTTIYAGPFNPSFVAVWPDGSNLVILTNFNSHDTPENLYRISLK